jgi:CBS-domain-containing membrane protein
MVLAIKTLPQLVINKNLPCIKPERIRTSVSENSPAIDSMTDFRQVMPVTAEPYYSPDLALDRMKTLGVRMLLVTDEHDDIAGVITSYDLQSEKPLRYAQDNDIGYEKMNIGMIMTPITETPAVDFNSVSQSLIRHIINTMKELDRPHILVVETQEGSTQKLRGMFSTSHIGKLLGRKIYEPLKASHSLAEIKRTINPEQ